MTTWHWLNARNAEEKFPIVPAAVPIAGAFMRGKVNCWPFCWRFFWERLARNIFIWDTGAADWYVFC